MSSTNLPGSHTYVTVNGQFLDVNGNGESGTITFTVNTSPMADLTDGFGLTGGSVTATLDSLGRFSVSMLACDDAAFASYNWAYTVRCTGTIAGMAGLDGVTLQPKYVNGATQNILAIAANGPSPVLNYAPGALLTTCYYAPASQQTYNLNTGSLAIMDTTNLSVSFTAPASGRVFADVTLDWAFAANGSLSAATDMFIGLCQHGNASSPVSIQSWIGTDEPNFAVGGRDIKRYYVTGLTPGTAYHWDLCGGMSSTTNISFAAAYAGPGGVLSADPVEGGLIQVFAA